MRTINIIIAPTGETKIETIGFVGGECRIASQLLETAIGKRDSERLTSEFYAAHSATNTESQNEG